jgi:hypothetical protein
MAQAKRGLFDLSVEEPEEEAKEEKTLQEKAPRKRKVLITEKLNENSPVTLLSEEDFEALRKEAREFVLEDQKKTERKKVLQDLIKKERRKYLPEEELLTILIDLPGHSKEIVIDSVHFLHNQTYVVPVSQYRSMNEIMYRAWQHEYIVGNVNRDRYFRPSERNINLHPGLENYQHPNTTIMRV